MATLKVSDAAGAVRLQNGQTGNAVSTNVVDRNAGRGPGLLKIVSAIGATPTVTVNIEGSCDGVDWLNVPYATQAAPETPVVAALTITTAVTSYYRLRPLHAWRFLRLVMSANTNVTLTTDYFE